MRYPVFLFALLITSLLIGNNVSVSNTRVLIDGPSASQAVIKFDLNWENSWRLPTTSAPGNYDAVWVFAKYRFSGQEWQHATLAAPTKLPAGAIIDIYDQVGAMIYRSAEGSGDNNFSGVELIWDRSSGTFNPGDAIEVKVFGIEMVYVPEDHFYVGDGTDNFNEFYEGGTALTPFQIASEGEITVGNTVGSLYYSNGSSGPGDRLGPIPATFPKGFAAFYCMKYELSQAQYVDFFNTLPTTVRSNFDPTRSTSGNLGKGTDGEKDHNGCSYTGGDLSTTLPNIPMNYINQVQSLAYLDWAGLRPITELEFEKVGRGPGFPVADDYAWGTTASSVTSTFEYANFGAANERITNLPVSTGNMINDLSPRTDANGPHRCGIVAASATNRTRAETGGSYYGVMELSGNLWERIVTVGSPAGRNYVGNHGNGQLATDGTANVSGWPAGTAVAFGIRAGAYVSADERCTISSRRNATADRNRADHDYQGFRGIRTAQ